MKLAHYILFIRCSYFFSLLCHAYYLAHFTTLLCIIFAGSVWQGIGHTVLVSALVVFLSDLSLQQFTLILKGDSCALGDLPQSTLLLE